MLKNKKSGNGQAWVFPSVFPDFFSILVFFEKKIMFRSLNELFLCLDPLLSVIDHRVEVTQLDTTSYSVV
jgi:hypothetical protein